MEQLRKIFHVECRENLETLEGELLQLDPSQVDLEVLNTIFRAAHSIKGGAGTFNLHEISEFTHAVETYLDLIRNQKSSSPHKVLILCSKAAMSYATCWIVGNKRQRLTKP